MEQFGVTKGKLRKVSFYNFFMIFTRKNREHSTIFLKNFEWIFTTRIKAIHIHPEYNAWAFQNDICLIELEKPVKLKPGFQFDAWNALSDWLKALSSNHQVENPKKHNMRPICLPDSPSVRGPSVGNKCYVGSYDGENDSYLQQARDPLTLRSGKSSVWLDLTLGSIDSGVLILVSDKSLELWRNWFWIISYVHWPIRRRPWRWILSRESWYWFHLRRQ